jgi:hypothetical protein
VETETLIIHELKHFCNYNRNHQVLVDWRFTSTNISLGFIVLTLPYDVLDILIPENMLSKVSPQVEASKIAWASLSAAICPSYVVQHRGTHSKPCSGTFYSFQSQQEDNHLTLFRCAGVVFIKSSPFDKSKSSCLEAI